jgi:hypothetical protein
MAGAYGSGRRICPLDDQRLPYLRAVITVSGTSVLARTRCGRSQATGDTVPRNRFHGMSFAGLAGGVRRTV